MRLSLRFACLAAAGCAAGFSAGAAAQQVVKPPIAQYWIDVATHSMAGMPEMPEIPGMPGLPGFMGGGAAAGSNHYGNARGMAPGRWLDLALYTRNKPSGSQASHSIPPGMQMGERLPLVPLVAQPRGEREPGEVTEDLRERPTGRVLIYWGCGEAVRAGQPRIIELGSADPQAFGRAFAGRYAPDRGARVAPGYSIWPNEENRARVPRGASLAGDHAIGGEGVPASMKFAIGPAQDFMPAIELSTGGALADSIALQWPVVRHARAYFLHALASAGRDLVLWSSAETPDTGMGLFDYLSNATIDRWLAEKVLLRPATTRCAVPRGIFASARDGGAMLRMIAWGSELNLAHPPRPSDPRTPWEPDWSARVRVKASTMAMLGVDMPAASRRVPESRAEQPGAPAPGQDAQDAQNAQDATPSIPGLPGGAGRAIDTLRGIFGR
ncbi:MAG: hypothetical protein KJZ98_09230 [Burkholderiaceae bacterium]|nr:hypothetical protein [Burkholderiaceae bacterium]MEB2352132.1 hypothetical protein [Burkholderiaceae bacterium]